MDNQSLINAHIKLNHNIPLLHVHVFPDNCIIPLTIIAISFFVGFEVLCCLWCDLRLNNKHDLYFRPFGSCAEVLTPGTVEKYFLPVIVSCFCFSFIILFYFSEIVQDTKSDGLQKHTQTRNSTLMGKVCCMEKDSNLN